MNKIAKDIKKLETKVKEMEVGITRKMELMKIREALEEQEE
jgi:hypothetical protein